MGLAMSSTTQTIYNYVGKQLIVMVILSSKNSFLFIYVIIILL